MEILILLCLITIIALLLQDKKIFRKNSLEVSTHKKSKTKESLMGESKKVESKSMTKPTDESHTYITQNQPATFEEEISDKKVDIQIPQEELDEIFGSSVNLEVEEEEWSQYQIFDNDNGLAQGVTFEELNSVEQFLNEKNSDNAQKETTAGIVQKIQGTELFNLLENSIEGASLKIAELLDNKLALENNSDSSFLRNDDYERFDIEKFI